SSDVLIVGGGPAGVAAACCAAEGGRSVTIVDDNPSLGGQVWRVEAAKPAVRDAAAWFEKLKGAGVARIAGARVCHQPESGELTAETSEGICHLRYKKLILATGARERFLPFPGWTIPNVMGAGGLQAMVKSGLPIAGERIVVAGTGPLLLAVASYLRKQGALISLLCEQAGMSSLARLSFWLIRQPKKLGQALSLRKDLAGISMAFNSWVLEAHGQKTLEAVTVSRNGKAQIIPCDYLACGFHLVPNIE